MLAAIRAFSKSWVAIILFLLLLVSLIIWGGMGDMLKNPVASGVITVGSHSVTPGEFEQQFTRQLEQIGQQQGGPPPPREEAIKAGFHLRMLEGMADQLSFAEALSRLGIVPSPQQFAERIQQVPAFFNEVTGAFDKKKYRELLAQNRISEKAFEQSTRDEIAFNHLAAGLQAGLVAPRAYGSLVAISTLENRTWSAFTLDPSKVAKPAPPTDAQLQAFINEFGQKKPETRDLTFVRFSTKAIEATMPVDQAELQKLYNFRKDTMAKPELRSLVQIPVKNAGQAEQVAQRLRSGEDPAAVAKSVGTEAITLTDQPKSAITDRKVADAAFALAAGQVSAPIQGELKTLSVVKVNEIKPALTVGFEQARPQLEQQLKHDAAQKKVYEQVEAYEKAHDGGANLTEAAKTVGATVVTSGPIAQNGATPTGQPPAGVSPKLLAKAFEMAQGEESDTQDEGNGEYFVVRVDKVTPSAFPQLEEVRGPATQAYIQRQVAQALKAKADELAARIRKGESFEAVAASAGAKVEHVAGVDRGKAQEQAKTSGMQVLQAVFGAAKNEVVVAPTNTGVAVVKVDDIQAGPIDQLAALADTSRRQANGELVNNLIEGAQAHARRVLKPRIDRAKAAQALGIDPKEMDQKPAQAPAQKDKG